MVEGFFGGPRPLLSLDCLLAVRDYTALPSPTISGGTSPDRTDEFQEAARSHLPVETFSTEEHTTGSKLFGDYLVAELETDRLQLNQFMTFVEKYADLLNVDDLRVVNVGIDARTAVDSALPRPFVNEDIAVFLLVEIRFPSDYEKREIELTAHQIESELDWITDSTRSGNTVVFQHLSGPNDLVVTHVLNMIDELEQYNIPLEDVTVTCSILETK